ncbi:MAG: phosphoribosyltransferase [Nitrospirae bacterium]|nr:phosphoribosyltransferase [Nitrospirota bacterium]
MVYKDRKDAGKYLASMLTQYKDRKDTIILALPRGGVVVGYEVSKALNCPLDIIIIRKIGCPGQPELAIGAVSETGTFVLNEDIISAYGVPGEYIEKEISKQKNEISRRKTLYRDGKDIPSLDGKTVILVDDGVATGATIKAAISTLKKENLARLVVALPVSSIQASREIKNIVDEWVCPETPEWFSAVGEFYQDFTQVSDEDVVDILKKKVK